MSTRQVQRLASRYRDESSIGLISRRYQRLSNNGLDGVLEQRVVTILRESYPDFGPTLAAEKPASRDGIVLAKETVRRLQMTS